MLKYRDIISVSTQRSISHWFHRSLYLQALSTVGCTFKDGKGSIVHMTPPPPLPQRTVTFNRVRCSPRAALRYAQPVLCSPRTVMLPGLSRSSEYRICVPAVFHTLIVLSAASHPRSPAAGASALTFFQSGCSRMPLCSSPLPLLSSSHLIVCISWYTPTPAALIIPFHRLYFLAYPPLSQLSSSRYTVA